MNDTNLTQQHDPDTQRRFWGTISLAVVLTLVSIYYVLTLARQELTPVVFLLLVIFAIDLLGALISAILVIRKQQELGARIVFYLILLLPIAAGVLTVGRTLLIIPVVLIISLLAIRYVLERDHWQWYAGSTAASLVIAAIFEVINPSWRIVLNAAELGPAAVIVLILIFTGLAVREAFQYNLRTKLVASFLVVTLIPLAFSAYINDRNSRQALTTEANEKLAGAAQQTASLLDQFMAANTNAVRTEAQFAAVVEYTLLPADQRAGSPEEERLLRYLAGASRADPVYLNSIGILDTTGITIMDTEAAAIGRDRSTRYYFPEVMRTNRPYASTLEYDSVTKKPSIYFAAPVHDPSGKIIGVLRKRYDAAVLMEYVSEQKGLVGTGSFAVLLDEYQMRIAHAQNISLIYKLVTPLDQATVTALQSERFLPPGSIEEISTNRPDFSEGLKNADTQPYFIADLTGDDQPEQVAVARMKTQNWQVAFAVPQTEFLAPINTQARNNILLTLGIAILVAAAGFLVSQTLSGPIVRLTQTAETIASGDINIQAQVETQDEIGTLAGTFNRMTQQLRDFINTLESRVAERTRNLELAAEVGRTVSHVRALDVMLTEAAELIRQQFDLYYVQVYLVNASQTYLNLQAGTGHVGKELLGRNHRLPFNADSINGRAAVDKQSVVISDTTASATFKPNPLLPDTRSEMAVPLMIGERVVGVLDMQSEKAGSLNKDTLAAFEALAGQLAIAIQNANFLAETEQARAEVEAQAQRLTRSNWEDYLDAIHKPEETGFLFEQNKVVPLVDEVEIKENALVTSISVTGEELGKLVVELEGKSPIANTDELVASVARQVSQQIENLRLLDSAERYRLEAEEASRRLTREGWKSYAEQADESLSYVYDLKEVRPQNNDGDEKSEVIGYSLPLKVRDEIIGKLVVQGLDSSDEESISLANAVAERLGTHLESLRQFEETQRGQLELDKRATELQAVAEISTQASIATNMEEMLQSMVELTKERFGLYHTHIYLVSDDNSELVLTAGAGEVGRQMVSENRRIGMDQPHSLVARAARSKKGVISNDVTQEPDFLPNPLLPNTRSEMAVPIMVGDTLLGIFDVQGDVINRFTDEDIAIKTTLSRQIAVALQNLRNFAKAQQQADRESRLNVISQKIQSATTVEAVLQIAARELGHTLGAPLTIAQLGLKGSQSGN